MDRLVLTLWSARDRGNDEYEMLFKQADDSQFVKTALFEVSSLTIIEC